MASKKILQSAVVLILMCCLVNADKKIELEDIELDNLKSERTKDGKDDYLQPPSPSAEQSANYGPPESRTYQKHQYAVEEVNQGETPLLVYPSSAPEYHPTGVRYSEVKRDQANSVEPQQDNYEASYQGSNSQGPLVMGYLQGNPVQYVYLPQYPSGNQQIAMLVQQYQPKGQEQTYYYQNSQDNTGYSSQEQKYQGNENVQQEVQSSENQSEEGNGNYQSEHVYTQTPNVNYVLVPQYQDPSKQQSLYQNYEGYVQQAAYTNAIPHDQANSVPDYKYVTSAVAHQSVAPHVNSQLDNLAPALSLYATQGQTGINPKVIPEYAHAVSRPIYAHISGNLVQDSQKQYRGQNLQHSYQPVRNRFNSVYNFYTHGKPKSLLDSYIPSSLQIEYLKRGLSKEPLATYDTIAYSQRLPKHFESGFLPNQMYPTGGGGAAYGKFKRTPKRKTA